MKYDNATIRYDYLQPKLYVYSEKKIKLASDENHNKTI